MAEQHAEGSRTWQQTKSAMTRDAILTAALDCIYEHGYAHTTTAKIAEQAGLSRGAMLHHFANRFDLIRAAIDFLNTQRLERYAQEEQAVQSDAEATKIDAGIDVYWRQLNTRHFTVLLELRVASRTDPELRAVLEPALLAFEEQAARVTRQLFPDLARSQAFQRAILLTHYLLEGMAIARATDPRPIPETLLLDWLKSELRESFQDVQRPQDPDADHAPPPADPL
ncbi:MAG: TetR/AcrR family transcriptional regulator [Pseudomonadota bacterium]